MLLTSDKDYKIQVKRRKLGLSSVIWFAVMLLVLAGTAVGAPGAEQGGDRQAVLAPLASQSLLLDITRAGERLVAVGERGHVLLSDDQGARWRQVPVPTRMTLTAVWFSGPQQGWAVGHDALVLHSADGGEHWRQQFRDQAAESPLLDIRMGPGGSGIAVGAYGLTLRSGDGGRHWHPEPLPDGDDFHLNAIADVGGQAYLAAEAGMLYRREHSGTWRPLSSPYEGSFFGILPLSDGGLLAFGMRGHLFRSEDRGDHWVPLPLDTRATLTDGLQLPAGRIVLVGHQGIVLWSDDGGHRFEQMQLPGREGLSALVSAANDRLFAAGEGGIHAIQLPAQGQP